MFLVAPNNILTQDSEVKRNLFCYVFDQLPYKVFGNSQLNQWVSKAFLQDKALLQDNSQYKIHNHKEIILFDYYQQLKYASPN
ncbi:hypothetical protein BW78_15425 [Escherichia coli O174:H21 str. 03-3269]|nr:hypothetical protein HQ24_02720 [Escherichia coli KLY]ALQ60280.1 hypothetical protein AB850_18035 [Escherichia coli]EYZ42110.1 hypothetical protein BW91_12055 [Escherichia coli O91:H14 str. 06-3691]EYZ58444.1 hypothetical protein BW88_04390 [Escherichia coli O79:H7 str. 06-3501]EZA02631.1 hypothetical protein BW78_15425 [Escherichia coli O174:H21 str. 03-3269]EZB59707.1 hypothetical protein BY60_04400 [Escherichia coli O15:H18 str. K1516]